MGKPRKVVEMLLEGNILKLTWIDSWVDGHVPVRELERLKDPEPLMSLGVVIRTSAKFVTIAHQISRTGDGIFITTMPICAIEHCEVLGHIDPDFWKDYE